MPGKDRLGRHLACIPSRKGVESPQAHARWREHGGEEFMAKYLLVSFKTCPWVQRVAIVLREKKIDFEFHHIESDNRPSWFHAISPHNKVPLLRLDDRVSLFESGAIAEYLDETAPPRLHPEDPVERAINRAWIEYLPTFADLVSAHAYADSEAEYNKAAAQVPVPFEK